MKKLSHALLKIVCVAARRAGARRRRRWRRSSQKVDEAEAGARSCRRCRSWRAAYGFIWMAVLVYVVVGGARAGAGRQRARTSCSSKLERAGPAARE